MHIFNPLVTKVLATANPRRWLDQDHLEVFRFLPGFSKWILNPDGITVGVVLKATIDMRDQYEETRPKTLTLLGLLSRSNFCVYV